MNRLLLAAAFAAFSAGAAHAALEVSRHDGSRDDVRAWCAAAQGVLSDREDYTMCVSALVPGTTYTCDDAGDCIRTGFDLTVTGSTRVPGPGTRVSIPEPHFTPYHYHGADVILIPSGKTFRQLPYMGYGGLELVE